MPKLDLTKAKQIKGPWGETSAMKDAGFSWVKSTAPSDPIAAYYGMGSGQVSLDLRADNPTVSGSSVTAIRNDGGAGSALSAVAAGGVGASPGYVTMLNGSQKLNLAHAADHAGVHLFVPMRFRGVSGSNRFPRPLWGNSEYLVIDQVNNQIGARSTNAAHPLANATVSVPDLQTGVWYLIETRYANGFFRVYVDGIEAGSVAASSMPFMLDTIGGTFGGQFLYADLGRSVGMITDVGNEPAIAVIRSTLTAMYPK